MALLINPGQITVIFQSTQYSFAEFVLLRF
ncbi:hypothetical protein LINGRAHAP2_LOCUS10996 [Linum grandiflorum]